MAVAKNPAEYPKYNSLGRCALRANRLTPISPAATTEPITKESMFTTLYPESTIRNGVIPPHASMWRLTFLYRVITNPTAVTTPSESI